MDSHDHYWNREHDRDHGLLAAHRLGPGHPEEHRSEQPEPDAAQRQQAIAVASRFLPIIGYFAPALAAISIFLIAAIMIFLTNVVMGADINFQTMLGIVGYGGIPPTLVMTALTILVMFMKSPEDYYP